MITENNYCNSVAAATELASKGFKLSVRPASILGQLVEASMGVWNFDTENDPLKKSTLLDEVWQSAKASASLPGVPSMHDRASAVCNLTLDRVESSAHSNAVMAAADQIAPIVLANISVAKNIVAPIVLDVEEKLTRFVNERPMDPSTMYNIVPRSVPSLVKDEVFMSDMEGAASLDLNWISFRHPFPSAVDDGFYQKLNDLGSASLNEQLASWLAAKGPAYLKFIYLHHFVSDFDMAIRETGNRYTYTWLPYDPSRYGNVYDSLDVVLGMYIVASKLLAEVIDVPGYTLVEYREDLQKARDYAASTIWRCIRAVSNSINAKQLVCASEYLQKEITVHESVWAEYLANAGKPEALLGILVSNRRLLDMATILEIKDALVAEWQSFVMLSQADIRGKMTEAFRDYAVRLVAGGLAEPTEIEKEYSISDPHYADKIRGKLEEELSKLDHHAMENIAHTALHLVAKCRFYFTSSYEILAEMELVARENPDVPPREAALLSALKYVAEFAVQQIIVTK